MFKKSSKTRQSNGLSNPLMPLRIAGGLAAIMVLVTLQQSDDLILAKPSSDSDLDEVVAGAIKLQKSGDWGKSATVLSPLAVTDNPDAMLEYAKLLVRGWGVPRDLVIARETLLQTVKHDFPRRGEAAFELAKVYKKSSGKDCLRIAFEWFNKSANWGYTKAHEELGKHYARGIGVAVDLPKALAEYKMASKNGSAIALLSFLEVVEGNPDLSKGLPPLEDLVADAISLLEKEALRGRGSSAKALGRLYLADRLIKPSLSNAKRWFRRGADVGDSGSMTELALLLVKDTPSKPEIDEALLLLRKASKLNNSGALTELGRLHVEGRFGLDPNEAVDLFERGVKAAHPGSMEELARMLLAGTLIEKDTDRAIALLRRGKALGHKGSISLLKTVAEELPTDQANSGSTPVTVLSGTASSGSTAKSNAKHPLSGATVIIPFGKKG